MYKGLIALDMDGTLLQEGFYVAQKEIDALKKASEEGYLITIATGRSCYAIKNKLEQLKLDGIVKVVMGCNGTEYIAVDEEDATVIANLTKENIAEAIKLVGDVEYGFSWYEKDLIHSNENNHYADNLIQQTGLPIKYHPNVVEAFPAQWNKAIFFLKREEDNYVKQILDEKITGDFKAVFSRSTFIELIPFGGSKANCIKEVCKKYGIDFKNTMGVGDNENDLEMIMETGFGVAMGNATQQIKDVADYITARFDENGVAQAVEVFMEKMKNN